MLGKLKIFYSIGDFIMLNKKYYFYIYKNITFIILLYTNNLVHILLLD